MSDTEFVDEHGKPLKGIQLNIAKKKAREAAAAAANGTAPAAAPAPVAPPAAEAAPAPAKGSKRPAAPPPPAPPAPVAAPEPLPDSQNFYKNILDAVQRHNPKFVLQHPAETGAVYLHRLLVAVVEIPDEQLKWDSEKNLFPDLLPGANAWIAEAMAAVNPTEGPAKPVPLTLAGFVDAHTPGGKAKGKGKAAGAPKEPKAKKEKAAKGPRVQKEGAVFLAHKWTAENPDGTLEQLEEASKAWKLPKPFTRATLSLSRMSALMTIRAVKAAGHWKD